MTPRDERWMRILDGEETTMDMEEAAEVAFFQDVRRDLRAAVAGGIDLDEVMSSIALNEALAGGIDVDEVMSSIALNEALAGGIDIDDVMSAVALNEALAGGIDIDDVMSSISLNEALAGGIDIDDVMSSISLNEALAGGIDIDDVMSSITLNDAVAGGIDLDALMASVTLNDAVSGGIEAGAVVAEIAPTRAPIDVDAAPANVVPLRTSFMPRWVSLGAVPTMVLAAAAAMLVGVWPTAPVQTAVEVPVKVEEPYFQLAAMNRAEVEDVSSDDGATVQIVQFEEDGPTVILVDDPGEL